MLLSAAPSGTPSEGEWNCHEGELTYRAVEGTYTDARTDRDVLLLLVRLRDLKGKEPIRVLVEIHVLVLDSSLLPYHLLSVLWGDQAQRLVGDLREETAGGRVGMRTSIDDGLAYRMKVTRFLHTAEGALSFQVASSGQYMTNSCSSDAEGRVMRTKYRPERSLRPGESSLARRSALDLQRHHQHPCLA